MAKKYLHNQTEIGWEGKGSRRDGYLRVDECRKGVEFASFDPPRLSRCNVTDLRDWLTAYLERTK